MTTSIVSLSEFKAKAAKMLSEMKTAEHPIILTQRGAASAVVHDYRVYQRLQNALLMLKLMVQGEADVARGRTIPQERVFADLEARLTADHGWLISRSCGQTRRGSTSNESIEFIAEENPANALKALARLERRCQAHRRFAGTRPHRSRG